MFKKSLMIVTIILVALAINPNVYADDTEIYFGRTKPANILLVLDTSGSMNTKDICERYRSDGDCAVSKISRLASLQNSVKDFLNNSKDNVKIGLMNFGGQHDGKWTIGGEILYPVAQLGEIASGSKTNRDLMLEVVNDLKATGGTPLTNAYYNAVSYYEGSYKGLSSRKSQDVEYDDPNGSGTKKFNRPVPIYNGRSFVSPIVDDKCELSNNIVLLTDGQPNSTVNYHKNDINSLLNKNSNVAACDFNNSEWLGTTGSDRLYTGKNCSEQLAKYLIEKDTKLIDGRVSNVNTYTIGFALAGRTGPEDFLKDVAKAAGGTSQTPHFFSASNSNDLVSAFESISDANTESGSFVAPSIPLSQSNRLSSGNELYLAMFKPEGKQLWHGNLKKYFLKDGQIVDKNNVAAVNANGSFKDSISSAWSSADGNSVELGGAAQAMALPRSVYSNILNKNIWVNQNQVDPTNNQITRELLGLASTVSDSEYEQHISWIYNQQTGFDSTEDGVKDTQINRFGDPLHSKPLLVRYSSGETVYVGSNEGYLHAINPNNSSGDELWSFMPRQLLSNVALLSKDKTLADPSERVYGLDGDITVYHDDLDNDGVVDINEKAYLYVGMRRGGKNYYAVDISNREKPSLMFTITGDEATYNETLTGSLAWDQVEYYDGLAETWSKPVIGNIKVGNQKKLVMVFGGGYDSETQDNETNGAGTADRLGNNIFIADAITGKLLWDAKSDAKHGRSGSLSTLLTNSFPSDLTVGDLTGSGTIEHFYTADTSGQIFRFDIEAIENPSDPLKIQGAKLADIQGSGLAGNRRFFNKPDVSFVRIQGKTIAAVAIGSGYRAHPLNEDTSDRFYVFFDEKVVSKEFETNVLIETDLYNITDKITLPDGTERFASIFDIFSANKNGWYLTLAKGEKVLSDSMTINYRSFFTTYIPTNDPDSCTISVGQNKLYGISILDGRPAFGGFDTNSNGILDQISERATDVNYVGIAPGFTVLFPDDTNGNTTNIVSFVGAEQICSGDKCDFAKDMQTVKWREIDDKTRDALINAK